MKNAKCPVCDYADNNPSEESSCCPRCGADFTGNAVEKKLMAAPGTYTTEDTTNGELLKITVPKQKEWKEIINTKANRHNSKRQE